jgi:glycosyltransferase involved in cell wall biosynthesis/Gpi18-like mannosyltransferase
VRVAYYSPLPPERSGIADYSALLLPALERRIAVEVVRRGRTRPVAADIALYHIGNDPEAHGWIVEALRRRPGVVVLHDFVLHHLVAGLTIGRKDGRAYLAALERDAGVAGRLLAHGVLDGRVAPLWETRPEEFPLAGDVLDEATGLIVHSAYVEKRARDAGYTGPLWRIPHPAWPAPRYEPERIAGRPIFGCFGHLNPSKRIPELVEAFRLVRVRHPEAKLLLVGPASPGFELDRYLGSGVERMDYVTEERLWSLMAACDVCVLLRAPTMGETSGTAIRALSLGRPLVVSDTGWFAELPDEVAFKIPADEGEVAAVAAALELLSASEPTRRAMSEAARSFAEHEHGLDRVAELYTAALEEAAGGAAVADAVQHEVARAAAEIGVEPGTPFAGELTARLDELGLACNGRPGPVVSVSPPRAGRLARVPAWVWLVALVVVSSLGRYALSRRVVAPWIMVDELTYSELAKSFAATGKLLIRGEHHGAYGFVYPVLIAPAWKLFSSIPDAYAAAKTIGSVTMSLAAIPAYFLARRVLRPLPSLGAAFLTVAVPSMFYTGTLMTETVFYPLFLCVALALVLALERPTALRQLVLLGACLLAFLARTQAVVLVPAVASAPLVLAYVERRWRLVPRAFRTLYGTLGLTVVAVLAIQLFRGRSPYDVLGSYSITGHTRYHVGAVLRWLVYHVAELDLYLGILPFAAFVLLAVTARNLDRPARVFVSAAVPLSAWLILEVAAFASALPIPPRVEERNMFYVAPFFLIGLLAWIERGMPRAGRAAAACAVAAAALPGVLPFDRLIDTPAESDPLALTPLWWMRDHLISDVALVVVAGAAILALAFLFLPARWAYTLPALVLAWFVFTQERLEFFGHGFPKASVGALFEGITNPHRNWIDRAVGRHADVAFVWSGENRNARAFQLWENEFFNRSLRRVYYLHGPSPGGFPETRLTQGADGTLLAHGSPARPPYALTDVNVHLAGRAVARDKRKGIVLLRPDGALRTIYTVTGLYSSDTWSGRQVTYTRPRCRGGVLSVPLASDGTLFPHGQTVTARSGGTTVTTAFPPSRATTLMVPVRPRRGRCTVTFIVVPTAIPALVGSRNTDTRVLGAHFLSFRFTGP